MDRTHPSDHYTHKLVFGRERKREREEEEKNTSLRRKNSGKISENKNKYDTGAGVAISAVPRLTRAVIGPRSFVDTQSTIRSTRCGPISAVVNS